MGIIKSTRMIPHYEKKTNAGEDAFFADINLLSIADGVGAWIEQGVDPARYSRKLVEK